MKNMHALLLAMAFSTAAIPAYAEVNQPVEPTISTLDQKEIELYDPIQAAVAQLELEITDMSEEEKEAYLSKIISGTTEQTNITSEKPATPTYKQRLYAITSTSIDAILIAGIVAAGTWAGYTQFSLLPKALNNVEKVCLKIDRNIGLRAIGTLLGLYITKRALPIAYTHIRQHTPSAYDFGKYILQRIHNLRK